MRLYIWRPPCHYIRVPKLLYTCPQATIYVSSSYYLRILSLPPSLSPSLPLSLPPSLPPSPPPPPLPPPQHRGVRGGRQVRGSQICRGGEERASRDAGSHGPAAQDGRILRAGMPGRKKKKKILKQRSMQACVQQRRKNGSHFLRAGICHQK
jgi:hypothetical protein